VALRQRLGPGRDLDGDGARDHQVQFVEHLHFVVQLLENHALLDVQTLAREFVRVGRLQDILAGTGSAEAVGPLRGPDDHLIQLRYVPRHGMCLRLGVED
jgi:hypothetical protein